MIQKTRLSGTPDDDRTLVTVTLERWPERANTYTVDVVYEVEHPFAEDFTIDEVGVPYFITLLSCTRTDTREPVALPPDLMKQVKQAAMGKAAELNDPLV
jgi:hypothetical protein